MWTFTKETNTEEQRRLASSLLFTQLSPSPALYLAHAETTKPHTRSNSVRIPINTIHQTTQVDFYEVRDGLRKLPLERYIELAPKVCLRLFPIVMYRYVPLLTRKLPLERYISLTLKVCMRW